MDESLKLIVTGDGSHTIYVPGLNETYHSVKGAIQESQYVFIKNGFLRLNSPFIRILEVGFGTGLNALLTYRAAKQNGVKVEYAAVEKFPLAVSILQSLNYTKCAGLEEFDALFTRLHEAPWNRFVKIDEYFRLKKLHTDIHEYRSEEQYGLIYFDAFAPSKQPDMWMEEIFTNIIDRLEPGGIFCTYSATGRLKRTLKTLGLNVQTLPGPPGKKEMVMAIKKETE